MNTKRFAIAFLACLLILAVLIIRSSIVSGRSISVEESAVLDALDNEVEGLDPEWSSDLAPTCDVRGDRIVYVSESRDQIFTQRRTKLGDFADPIAQTGISSGVTYTNPTWSKTDLRIAYEKEENNVTTIHYFTTLTEAGTAPTPSNVTADTGYDYHNPRWNTQGELVYERTDGTKTEILKFHEGCGQTILVSNDDHNTRPAWSPDGSRVVFVREETSGDPDSKDLYLVSAEFAVGSNDYVDPEELTNDALEDDYPIFGEEPVDSTDPDDLHDFVIYQKREDGVAESEPWWNLYDIFPDLTTPTERLLTDTLLSEFPDDHNHIHPDWRAMNPRLVLYVKQNADHATDLDPEYEVLFRLRRPEFHDSTADADEIQVTDLINGAEGLPGQGDDSVLNQHPSFAPSSQNLIYIKEVDGGDGILHYVNIVES